MCGESANASHQNEWGGELEGYLAYKTPGGCLRLMLGVSFGRHRTQFLVHYKLMQSYKSQLQTTSNILFTCEHASGRIPRVYHSLGLTRRELQQAKDWYDIGALALMQELAKAFDASYLYTTFSRLVIDANRGPHAILDAENSFHAPALKQSVLIDDHGKEKVIDIPANCMRNAHEEGESRWETYVQPYYSRGSEMIRKLREIHDDIYIIPIHSFSPTYNGEVRTIDIDVLSAHAHAQKDAHKILHALEQQTSLVLGDNEPWALNVVDGGVWGEIAEDQHIHLIPFDINQRQLMDEKNITQMATLLATGIRAVDNI